MSIRFGKCREEANIDVTTKLLESSIACPPHDVIYSDAPKSTQRARKACSEWIAHFVGVSHSFDAQHMSDAYTK